MLHLILLACTLSAQADTHVYDPARAVEDRRAHTVRETNTVFTMPHFHAREAWEQYAEKLRRQILLSSGLWPLPEKTPLNARIFDEIEREDYTVAKVHFEAWPGFLVTGNLYRPKGEGPFPAVVNPHGHWADGRLEDSERGSVPGRGITLACMGMVAFMYDMIGYQDSMQFPHNWGTEEDKLWGVHPFSMQLWMGIRSVDFLETLPYVDKNRIGATGASGGGTQTFALTAVEPRIKVSAPVNMISSTMQGGCLCENAPILRLDNSNMEIGALMAPRPLLLVSATGDWTRESPRVEYPAIRSIFELYDAENRVKNVHIDAGHNYNQASREAMYRFFAQWLQGREGFEDYTEPGFDIEAEEDLRVFADADALAAWPGQEEIIATVKADAEERVQQALEHYGADTAGFLDAYRGALKQVIGAEIPDINSLDAERVGIEDRGAYVLERWIISRAPVRDAIPALFYRSREAGPQDAVLIVHGAGKSAFAAEDGPGPLVRGLLEQDKAVLAIDLFLQGEHHAPGAPTERLREGAFMDTFQPTDTGYQVQDMLTALSFLRARRDLTGQIDLVALGGAGVPALFAGAIDGGLRQTLADFDQFSADEDAAWVEKHYIPCIRAIGDVRTAVALLDAGAEQQRGPAAHAQVLVFNTGGRLTLPQTPARVLLREEDLQTEDLLARLAS